MIDFQSIRALVVLTYFIKLDSLNVIGRSPSDLFMFLDPDADQQEKTSLAHPVAMQHLWTINFPSKGKKGS